MFAQLNSLPLIKVRELLRTKLMLPYQSHSLSCFPYIPSKPHTIYISIPTSYLFLHPSSFTYLPSWLCPRPISNSQLHVLPHFHLCPIYLVVFKGSYYLRMGYLVLRGTSRLDAFSVYPVPAWLLCHALGRTTDSPAASPPRSSRTKGSSSQISYAHAG